MVIDNVGPEVDCGCHSALADILLYKAVRMAKSVTITTSVPRLILSLCTALADMGEYRYRFLLVDECRYYVDVIS